MLSASEEEAKCTATGTVPSPPAYLAWASTLVIRRVLRNSGRSTRLDEFYKKRNRLPTRTRPYQRSVTLPAELQDSVAILDFDTPTRDELLPIYQEVVESLDRTRQPQYTPEDVGRILSLGAGMTAQEFENACSRALVQERALLPHLPIDVLCGHIAAVKTEVVKRSEVLELMEPVRMEDVGGLDALKDWVAELGYSFSEEAREEGVDAAKGCAVVGPP